jgi:hypothetical protein
MVVMQRRTGFLQGAGVLALELESVFSARAKENQAIQFKGSSPIQKSEEVKPIETRQLVVSLRKVCQLLTNL